MENKPSLTFQPGTAFDNLKVGDIIRVTGPMPAPRPWYLRWLTPIIGPRIVREKYMQIMGTASSEDFEL